ncbi:hypothetical protein [Nocardioides sp. LHG3406-4]|uniref:lytic transglycosylase domain-containing protein n=1 Tax=Nocardioides sp. LHG3406-4 TaxID=2804575 RepID=UPI003CF833C6
MRSRRLLPAAALCAALTVQACSDAAPADPPSAAAEPSASTSPASPATAAELPDVAPARSAREVARQIVAAEDAIASATTPAGVLAGAGHLQQLAYRELAAHPRWDARVRSLVPRRLLGLVRDNVASRREFRSMHPTDRADLSDELPAWRIVPPAPMRRLRAFYGEAERRFGVDREYLAAINLVETGLGRIRGTSSAGAQGPMQFLPSTWSAYGAGGDIHSAHDSILAAGRFLAAHGFNRPGGRPGALYRYNNSTSYVRGVTLLAEVMKRRPTAFRGYYHWQVYYLTDRGSILLPEGYAARKPIPVDEWLEKHPQ